MEIQERKSYSLSQLAGSIQSVIRKAYASEYWIRAEMARLNYYPHSGHCYPDLVEKEGNEVKAQMRALIWSSDFNSIQRHFTRLTGKPLQDDIEILFNAKVDYNPKYGLSLRIVDIDPEFTLGQMLAEKQAFIRQLKAEKLYDRNKQIEFPRLPQRIAIISVESSKGYHDLLQVFEQNPKGYVFHHQLFPALLQGEKAVESIARQLQVIEEHSEDYDLVAIVRGGGGEVGLAAYDHYDLASVICRFPLPVLTGVGHSTNETVSEMVAWKNAITPTDLGFFLVAKMEEQDAYISELTQSLAQATRLLIEEEEEKHKHLGKLLRLSGKSLLQHYHMSLDKTRFDLQSITRWLIQKDRDRFAYFARTLTHQTHHALSKEDSKVQGMADRLPQARSILRQHSSRLDLLTEKVKLLDPANVLKKGYSMTLHKGKIITDASKLKEGDTIQVKMYQAEIESTINNIKTYDQETDL